IGQETFTPQRSNISSSTVIPKAARAGSPSDPEPWTAILAGEEAERPLRVADGGSDLHQMVIGKVASSSLHLLLVHLHGLEANVEHLAGCLVGAAFGDQLNDCRSRTIRANPLMT